MCKKNKIKTGLLGKQWLQGRALFHLEQEDEGKDERRIFKYRDVCW